MDIHGHHHGNISVIRAQAGSSAGISLRNPPNVSGS